MKVEKTHQRENRFSGESIMLTRKEAQVHDGIFYYEYLATLEDKKAVSYTHLTLPTKRIV